MQQAAGATMDQAAQLCTVRVCMHAFTAHQQEVPSQNQQESACLHYKPVSSIHSNIRLFNKQSVEPQCTINQPSEACITARAMRIAACCCSKIPITTGRCMHCTSQRLLLTWHVTAGHPDWLRTIPRFSSVCAVPHFVPAPSQCFLYPAVC